MGDIVVDIAMALFLLNLVWSLLRGARAGSNPWNAGTLEWATASPPPPNNFTAIPIVNGSEPLWEPGGVSGRVELPIYRIERSGVRSRRSSTRALR